MKHSYVLFLAILLVSCASSDQFKKQLRESLKEDPSILTEAMEAHPLEVITALQKVSQSAQEQMIKEREDDERKKMESSFDGPLTPHIRPDENFRGNPSAPLTLVEYSDFQCPFCAKAKPTVDELLNKYGNNIRFVYKHLPLSFHQDAMVAAQYYEALRLQDPHKAWKLHDRILNQQGKLKEGESFLKQEAKKLGADMARLAKDIKGEMVSRRIEEDMKEAESFGIQGTPGFVLNGVPVKGAYPLDHFVGIVDELVKRGKVTLHQ